MSKTRIVVVEDNPGDVFLIRKALQEKGIEFELTCFDDGQEALKGLPESGQAVPDLILLDLNLPKVDGVDVLRAIRQMPRFADVPVAILTSSESPLDRHRTESLGASRYIKKSSTLEDFLSSVGGAVEEMLELRSRKDG
ncbi:MAG: response regulator [Bryobacteraceae bacterium]